MFDSWLTLSGSGMDMRSIDRYLSPNLAPGHGAWGRPLRFTAYSDPGGRFELGYPMGWTLETGPAVLVRSNRLATFARVDVLPRADASWEDFRGALASSGGTLTIQKERATLLRGVLDWGGSRFNLLARRQSRGSETLVFSTASEAGLDAPFHPYESQILSAIRREFRVLSPASTL
jgi:hypothetical protein